MTDTHPESHAEDERLLEELRRVVELVDPVPSGVLSAARGSLTWRTIDAELAALAYDSAVEARDAALVRTAGGRRLLTFEAPSLTVEVEVTAEDSTRRLVGQLVPPSGAAIEIRHAGGAVEVEADELGRFAAEGIQAGPVSLVCRLAAESGSRTVATDWLVI